MARHAAECEAMIAAFAAAHQKLFVAYYRRAMPRFEKVRALLEGRAIGQLTGVNYRYATPTPANADPAHHAWRVSAANAGGGLFLDLGSHLLDTALFWLGKPFGGFRIHSANCFENRAFDQVLGAEVPAHRIKGNSHRGEC